MQEPPPWREHSRLFMPHVSCLSLDPQQDLLWTGLFDGSVVSHFTHDYSRYTSYAAHAASPPKELIVDDRGVFSVGDDSLKLANRRGLTLWTVPRQEKSHNYTSMAFASNAASEIVAGGSSLAMGAQPEVITINAHTGTIIRRADSKMPVSFVRRSQLICCGTADGTITMRDPRTLKPVHNMSAHNDGLSGMETQGHLLFSIGYTIRKGVPVTDPLVKVFDVRSLRPMSPISFPANPAFIKPHPTESSSLFILASQGSLQISSLVDVSDVQFLHAETSSYFTGMTLASTGQAMMLTDAEGTLHTWATNDEPELCRYHNQIELPDHVEPLPLIDWNDETPMSVVPSPYTDEQLFSDLPDHVLRTRYTTSGRPPSKIDPGLLAQIRMIDGIGYAPNPRTSKRNVLTPTTSGKVDKRKMSVPLFRSEKGKIDARNRAGYRSREKTPQDELEIFNMPKHYYQVEIKYSKFGIEDFDFAYYNKTEFSGLETHITNSYANSLLQILRFCKPFAFVAENHTRTACNGTNCLLCEAGFLFKMMDDAKGVNCQASNFSKAFSKNTQAAALGLMDMEETSSDRAYSSLIQILNRFLIETVSVEAQRTQGGRPFFKPFTDLTELTSPISQIFGLEIEMSSVCTCGHQTLRTSTTSVIDLVYPRKAIGNEASLPRDFASILGAGITRASTAKSLCSSCSHATVHKLHRNLTGRPLPPVLAINAAVHTADQLEFWVDSKDGQYLAKRIAISSKSGKVVRIEEGQDAPEADMVIYELASMIAQIQSADDPAHLVSIVKVPLEELEAGIVGHRWHLFNDFLVRPIPEEEALGFPGDWKIPAVLYYQRVDLDAVIDYQKLSEPLDTSILCEDLNIAKHRNSRYIKHTILGEPELPRRGTYVAIDAEFVALQLEEAEYHSNGTKIVTRPSRQTLARVSVLRCEGEQTGVPFIDDHISTTETVVDHLTEFSGIRPGDLDAGVSRHTVVPLKVAYKKLRMLVDLGCIFIGHGLIKDFRIINIYVPPEQIVDTVNIYHIPARQRKISLRFLAWAILGQDIQSTGVHDSVEDARTALQLWEKHNLYEAEGVWDDKLEALYIEGHKHGWRVPGSTAPRASTPNLSANALPGLTNDMSPSAYARYSTLPAQYNDPQLTHYLSLMQPQMGWSPFGPEPNYGHAAGGGYAGRYRRGGTRGSRKQ